MSSLKRKQTKCVERGIRPGWTGWSDVAREDDALRGERLERHHVVLTPLFQMGVDKRRADLQRQISRALVHHSHAHARCGGPRIRAHEAKARLAQSACIPSDPSHALDTSPSIGLPARAIVFNSCHPPIGEQNSSGLALRNPYHKRNHTSLEHSHHPAAHGRPAQDYTRYGRLHEACLIATNTQGSAGGFWRSCRRQAEGVRFSSHRCGAHRQETSLEAAGSGVPLTTPSPAVRQLRPTDRSASVFTGNQFYSGIDADYTANLQASNAGSSSANAVSAGPA